MPPAQPAKKDARKKGVKKKSSAKRKGAAKDGAPKKSALCHTCGSRIRIPDGWTVGPAVRRHYWAKHRSTMQKDGDR